MWVLSTVFKVDRRQLLESYETLPPLEGRQKHVAIQRKTCDMNSLILAISGDLKNKQSIDCTSSSVFLLITTIDLEIFNHSNSKGEDNVKRLAAEGYVRFYEVCSWIQET